MILKQEQKEPGYSKVKLAFSQMVKKEILAHPLTDNRILVNALFKPKMNSAGFA